MPGAELDEIGPWSEVKVDVLKRYAVEYCKILDSQKSPSFDRVYIDGFAGPGVHISRTTGEMVAGSPLNALEIRPPFHEYHLIDLDGDRVDALRSLAGNRSDVNLYKGNCNKILLEQVFPRVSYEKYKRGLCILDPYALHLDWEVIRAAGSMKSLEVFINFPIYDININVLHHHQKKVLPQNIQRMNSFWGDESWRDVAYEPTGPNLFGEIDFEKVSNEKFASAFRKRLMDVAGFKRVPAPLPMRNSKDSVVYYLFFASQKDTAENIVAYIFDKFGRGKA